MFPSTPLCITPPSKPHQYTVQCGGLLRKVAPTQCDSPWHRTSRPGHRWRSRLTGLWENPGRRAPGHSGAARPTRSTRSWPRFRGPPSTASWMKMVKWKRKMRDKCFTFSRFIFARGFSDVRFFCPKNSEVNDKYDHVSSMTACSSIVKTVVLRWSINFAVETSSQFLCVWIFWDKTIVSLSKHHPQLPIQAPDSLQPTMILTPVEDWQPQQRDGQCPSWPGASCSARPAWPPLLSWLSSPPSTGSYSQENKERVMLCPKHVIALHIKVIHSH